MNSVMLIGRLTRDPEVRYTSGSQMAVANFTLAIDRPVREKSGRPISPVSLCSAVRRKHVRSIWRRAGW